MLVLPVINGLPHSTCQTKIKAMKNFLILISILAWMISSHSFAQTASGLKAIGNIAVTSDYVFRGLSQSDSNPVVQGGVDLILPQGIYTGIWISGVDKPFGAVYNQVGGDEDAEIDVYLGWAKPVGNDVKLDAGLIRYSFTPDDDDISWAEAYFGVGKNGFDIKASVNVEGNDIFGEYFEAAYRRNVSGVDLKFHVGRWFLDEVVRGVDEYTDYSIGIAKSFSQLKDIRVDLTFFGTDDNGRQRYTVADDKLVLTLSKTFSLTGR